MYLEKNVLMDVLKNHIVNGASVTAMKGLQKNGDNVMASKIIEVALQMTETVHF